RGAETLGVPQQHLVELGPEDLKGEMARVEDMVAEAVGGRRRSVDIEESHARLAHEALLHFSEDSELLEDPVAEGKKRLAHVIAREDRSFQNSDVESLLRQVGRRNGPRWTPTDDDD